MQMTKKCEYILALDPSGNFNEGKGKTGWVLMSVPANRTIKFGEIDAGIFTSMEAYWEEHISLIQNLSNQYEGLHVVMEDYLLYKHEAMVQVNSRMETPKLIGVIQYHCFLWEIPLSLQTASSVKARWKDKILEKKGYITSSKDTRGYFTNYINTYRVSNHTLDALRHAVHYKHFKINEQ